MLTMMKKIARGFVSKPYLLNRRISRELRTGEPELRLLPLVCRTDGELLDVGANQGIYSGYAARFADKVIAIEPHPVMAAQLARAMPKNVQLIRAAASDHAGTAELKVPTQRGLDVDTRSSLQSGVNPGYEERTLVVDLIKIDSLHLNSLSAMKIDVEGHEFTALAGAADTIARCKPIVIVECEERHNRGGTQRIARFFTDVHYDGFFIYENKLRSVSEFDPVRMQDVRQMKSADGGRSTNYVNNFIFIAAPSVDVVNRIDMGLAGSIGSATPRHPS